MNTLYQSFIITFLQENHPEILRAINRTYQPDLANICKVIDCYCEFYHTSLQQITGEFIGYKDTSTATGPSRS